ncbi:MAG: hypothetical protein ABR616_15730 [Dermatophilaceae bacterium]|nr:hypothetical protein [Intrasporangiaceae bacterium]
MQVSGTRAFKASLGNYGEKYEASRSVTAHHIDLGYTDEEWLEHVRDVGTHEAFLELADFVMEEVNDEIADEIEEADRLRDPSEDSFILRLDPPGKKNPSTKKVKRKRS